MEQGYRQVLYHGTSDENKWEHPRVISLGGDHSIVLPILRSLKTVYGPISVIHLDSHLDTYVARNWSCLDLTDWYTDGIPMRATLALPRTSRLSRTGRSSGMLVEKDVSAKEPVCTEDCEPSSS